VKNFVCALTRKGIEQKALRDRETVIEDVKMFVAREVVKTPDASQRSVLLETNSGSALEVTRNRPSGLNSMTRRLLKKTTARRSASHVHYMR
jgi:Holliday junction resolvasome RuvABC ATP-dependent DNA helicase subunit